MMDGNQIATFLAVFIGGVCTYEYSMWRTRRYIKKLTAPYMSFAKTILSQKLPVPEEPKRKPDDYE